MVFSFSPDFSVLSGTEEIRDVLPASAPHAVRHTARIHAVKYAERTGKAVFFNCFLLPDERQQYHKVIIFFLQAGNFLAFYRLHHIIPQEKKEGKEWQVPLLPDEEKWFSL